MRTLTQDHTAGKGQSQDLNMAICQAWIPNRCTVLPVTCVISGGGGASEGWLSTLLTHQHNDSGTFSLPSAPCLWVQRLPSIGELMTLLGLLKLVFIWDSLEGLWKRLEYKQASDPLVTCRQPLTEAHPEHGMDTHVAPHPGAGSAA